ncbi:MFS transporter [Metabacillus schmidteae]|uniref:MFS transporter n=1 Tax=Metabacillus schmidteae TaxID=2730405 RepID=UPI00158AF0A1|nr:MFS transporter [Metabacillus schmidteae]
MTNFINFLFDTWRVVLFPSSSAASNVHLYFFMGFFLIFSTEALNLNPVFVGFIMTVMRLLDGITDPVVGSMIDRTQTRIGKFTPFLLVGSFLLAISLAMIIVVPFYIHQHYHYIWVISWYAIWMIGYTCMTTVNKSALSIITRNPKHRPISGITGGLFSVGIQLIIFSAIVPILQNSGGMSSQEGWMKVLLLILGLHLLLFILGLFSIVGVDKPQFYMDIKASTKMKLKDYFGVIKENRALQMLLIAASTDKLASTVNSASTVYFYMYAVKNLDLLPFVKAVSTPVAFFGAFIAGGIAIRFGVKKTFVLGAWGSVVVTTILIIFRPFANETSVMNVFIVLMALNLLFRRLNDQNVNPMIADIIDYHTYKTGRFMPGTVGATFTFVEKMISSFGSTIVGLAMGAAGYAAGAEPTTALFWTVIGLYLVLPLLSDIASILAMKFYPIDNEMYKKMYSEQTVSKQR